MLTMMMMLLASEVPAMTIEKVASGGPDGLRYLWVTGGDVDGDGMSDDAIIRFTCSNGLIANAHVIASPRDAGSGMATGKRQHSPITITKEWEAASAKLAGIKPTYDIKTNKGTRMAPDPHGWQPITLAAGAELCAATQRATKTRSNIQNN